MDGKLLGKGWGIQPVRTIQNRWEWVGKQFKFDFDVKILQLFKKLFFIFEHHLHLEPFLFLFLTPKNYQQRLKYFQRVSSRTILANFFNNLDCNGISILFYLFFQVKFLNSIVDLNI